MNRTFFLYFLLFFSPVILSAKVDNALLFYQPCDSARASFSMGNPNPNYINAVSLINDSAVGKSAFHLDYRPLLSYFAPGNIYAERGTLSFFWRASTPLSETEFPIFRVGYADHTSWDMCWLRIDFNGHGFDAFVTDVNLARVRVSTTVSPLPEPEKWTHLALTWDENDGIRFYINGVKVAQKDTSVVLNAGLDQFGPHARIISPYQVQSAYSFSRGGDIDEIAIFSEALSDADVKTLSGGKIPSVTKGRKDFTDPAVKKEWEHYYGFDGHAGPYLSDKFTTVRKVQLNDVYDIKRWYWKSNDGIRETTWPGVYNRSSIIGRNDYFQLPDWDCYSASGKSVRFIVPAEERWNCVEINGGAWGTIGVSQNAEGTDCKIIAQRERGLQHSSELFGETRLGQTIVFTNAVKETPVSEFDLFDVHEGDAPKGICTLRYMLADFNNYQNPALEEVEDYVKGRFPSDQRQMLLAMRTDVNNARRSKVDIEYSENVEEKKNSAPADPGTGRSKPIVHIVIPGDTRDLDINVPLTLASQTGDMVDVALHAQGTSARPYSWAEMQAGLDGIRVELPPLDVRPQTQDGLFPMNIQVKDPIWKLRNMLDFSFSVKPGEGRTLWLDLRDRVLPDDKPLYITIAGSGDDFNASMLKGMKIELVFKDRREASREHIEDRLTQVRDAYAMICEESPTSRRLGKFAQFMGDMEDLLRVDPDNVQGRKYWYIYNPEQVPPEFNLPAAPDGVPDWAFYQLEILKKYKSFLEYYIDRRQNEDGEFGGGISDDSDLGNQFPGLVYSGVMPGKATASLKRLLDADDAQKMLKDGMCVIQTDGLHAYEEGVNIIDQVNMIDRGNPKLVERMMQCALAVKTRLIGENSAGHMHFRSDHFSATRIATEGVWAKSQRREFLNCAPALLLGEFYGNKGARADMLRFADDQLAHAHTDKSGRVMVPLELDFNTDKPSMYGVDFAAALYKYSYNWTKNKKYAAVLPGSTFVPAEYDSRTVVPAYIENLRTIDLYDYIYKDGSIWIDRLYFPIELLQNTRLGGIGLNKGSNYVPCNPVTWQFDGEDSAESIAILVSHSGSSSLKIQFYNTCGSARKVTMRGLEVAGGLWKVREGIDSDDNGIPDSGVTERKTQFGRESTVDFTVPSHENFSVEMSLEGEGSVSASRPEIGIGREDVRIAGGMIMVTVHNLGGVDVKNTDVALCRSDGKVLARTSTGSILAPNDYLPKTVTVAIPVPSGVDISSCKVTLDPENRIKEIYESNNSVGISDL